MSLCWLVATAGHVFVGSVLHWVPALAHQTQTKPAHEMVREVVPDLIVLDVTPELPLPIARDPLASVNEMAGEDRGVLLPKPTPGPQLAGKEQRAIQAAKKARRTQWPPPLPALPLPQPALPLPEPTQPTAVTSHERGQALRAESSQRPLDARTDSPLGTMHQHQQGRHDRTRAQGVLAGSGQSDPTPARERSDFDILARPSYRKNPPTPYPLSARRRGQEGVVLLEVRVGENGRALRVKLKHGSGVDVLDEAALTAVRTWWFEPARLGKRPVASTIEIPVRFSL